MHNIILLASDGQRVGKTYLAKDLVSKKICSDIDAFAIYIKKLALDLHKGVSYIPLSKEEFYQTRKDDKILNGHSPRDLVCDLSDMVQKFYGEEVWAEIVHTDLLQRVEKNPSEAHNIVIDDWRRLIESDYLHKQEKFNLVKVYLKKKGLKKKASKASASYEGQIKPEDCDIVFEFTEDYSNYDEVIELIKAKLK